MKRNWPQRRHPWPEHAKELTEKRQQIDALSDENKSLLVRLETLDELEQGLNQSVGTLQDEMTNACHERAELERFVARREVEFQNLESAVREGELRIEELEKTVDEQAQLAKSQSHQSEDERKRFDAQLTRANKQLTQGAARLREADTRAERLQGQLTAVRAKRDELSAQLKTSKQQLRAAEREQRQLQGLVKRGDRQRATLEKQFEKNLVKLQSQLATLSPKND